jgi:hypothetical protein
MNVLKTLSVFALGVCLHIQGASADSTEARCDIYPAGEDHTDKTIPCTFSQRQGFVTIRRGDGVVHDLEPVGDEAGNFRDTQGRPVYRQSGLGDQGLIFRFPDTTALKPEDESSPTWPFTTNDYDATALLRCRGINDADFAMCPAGILRMEGGEASIVVQDRNGEQFTINFMTDYVNATNREAEASLEGDVWTVIINKSDVYEIPIAAIQGG